jgi:hypothetical protein
MTFEVRLEENEEGSQSKYMEEKCPRQRMALSLECAQHFERTISSPVFLE